MIITTHPGNVDSTTVANASLDDTTVEEVDADHKDEDDDDAITATVEWKTLHLFYIQAIALPTLRFFILHFIPTNCTRIILLQQALMILMTTLLDFYDYIQYQPFNDVIIIISVTSDIKITTFGYEGSSSTHNKQTTT